MIEAKSNEDNVFVRVKLDDLSKKTARFLTGDELNKKAEKDLQIIRKTNGFVKPY